MTEPSLRDEIRNVVENLVKEIWGVGNPTDVEVAITALEELFYRVKVNEIRESLKLLDKKMTEEFEHRIEPLRKVWDKFKDDGLWFSQGSEGDQIWQAIKSVIEGGSDAK